MLTKKCTLSKYFFLNIFFSFLATTAYVVPGSEIRSDPQLQPTPQARQSRKDPLTHCAGHGIEPASWGCREARVEFHL